MTIGADTHLSAARLSAADVGVLLDAIVRVAEPVRLAFLWRPALSGPGDNMVLETALNGRADLLVTFNQHDFVDAEKRFRVRVRSPRDAIRILEDRA